MSETSTKVAIVDPRSADQTDPEAGRRLWQIIGAVKLGNRLAESLSSQSIHAVEQIRDEKLYLAEGFKTLDEFLDKHPDSPMSHDAFRRRVNLLQNEGDITFDLLNSLNVPLSARKMLGGNVSVDDDHLVITDEKGDTTSSTRIPLNDRVAIVKAFTEIKKKADEQARTIERGKKDVDKWKRKHDEAQEQLTKGLTVSEDGAPHARALVSILGGYQVLANECKSLTNEDERKRFAPIAFQRLAEAQKLVEEALGFSGPSNTLDLSGDELAAAAGE